MDEIDEKATVAPVYDPEKQRISVYYAHKGYLRWTFSDNLGGSWATPTKEPGTLVSDKFVHAIYWPSETTTALVAFDGQVSAFEDGLPRGTLKWAPAGMRRPFLVDLGGGKVTVLYSQEGTGTPMMTNFDFGTSSWSTPAQPVYLPETGVQLTSYSFTWSVRGAINQVPNDSGYDRHLYVFYGASFWEMYTDEGWDKWYMHAEAILTR